MKHRIVRYAVMLMAVGLFSFGAYQLFLIYDDSTEAMSVNDEVSNMFMEEVAVSSEELEQETDTNSETDMDSEMAANSETDTNSEVDTNIEESESVKKFVWDFDKMLAYNQESLGYIRQEDGEHINNPILQHRDNDYYLNHMPNGSRSSLGSLFLDYRIEEGLEAKNAIVYGHNMGRRVNYAMFGSLRWYLSDAVYAKEHPTMDVYVGEKHYKYYVFACYRTAAEGSDTYQYAFSGEDSFLDYISRCLDKSVFQFEEAGTITAEDKILTLSTCTSDDKGQRTIVQLVRREEIKE